MNRKTVFALVGLQVIALAAVGVGYGLWFEDLKIHGDVQTGELDVDWSGPFLFQYFDIYGPDGRVHQAFPEEKQGEVYCDAVVGNNLVHDLAEFPADLEGQDDPNTLLIKVGGAYPSYHCLVIGNMVNTGTVPVHVAWWWQEYYPGVKFFMFPVDAASLDGFESDLAALAESDPAAALAMAETDAADVECAESETQCYTPWQFHTGEGIVFLIDIHFNNLTSKIFDIGENEEYSFGWVFRFYQWNEQPWMAIP